MGGAENWSNVRQHPVDHGDAQDGDERLRVRVSGLSEARSLPGCWNDDRDHLVASMAHCQSTSATTGHPRWPRPTLGIGWALGNTSCTMGSNLASVQVQWCMVDG